MKKELKKEIGKRMYKIRKTLGYTQEEMVSFFNIGRANYSRVEKGEVLPNPFVLNQLRTKFDISLDWLISNTGHMFVREDGKKENEKKISLMGRTLEIQDLLTSLHKDPIIKHAILAFVEEYKVKHSPAINGSLEETETADEIDLEDFEITEKDATL
ncbi:MAG: helix-turn-helix domain-containing protein [Candidatus Omnitrophota bacterium]